MTEDVFWRGDFPVSPLFINWPSSQLRSLIHIHFHKNAFSVSKTTIILPNALALTNGSR